MEFIPEACKGKDAQFKGLAVLKVPSYAERMGYMSKVGVKVNAKGEVDFGEAGPLAAMAKAAQDLGKYVVSCNFEYDGKKVTKYQDLSCDPDFDPISQELAGLVMSGFKVGKKQPPK